MPQCRQALHTPDNHAMLRQTSSLAISYGGPQDPRNPGAYLFRNESSLGRLGG